MNTQKNVNQRLSKLYTQPTEEKQELSSEKVELSLVSDFEQAFSKAEKALTAAEPTYGDILDKSRRLYREIDSIVSDIESASKFYSNLEKGAKDLGIALDSNISKKASSLSNFLKTANQIKNELKGIV